MTRKLPEWIGKDANTTIPARVKLRMFERAGGKCEGCTRKIMTGERWDCDHITALVNGGENRENNLQVLCPNCHRPKTKRDVAIKAKTARVRSKHLGIKKPRKASKWKRKMDGTVVLR